MFEKELQLMKTFLKKHLNKRFIVSSFAPFVFSMLFAKKSSDELRFCVNYRRLNIMTKKNRYFLSLISKLMNKFSKTKIFIKINIKHAFNKTKIITKKNKDLIIFKTCFEIYKFLMLFFELTNGSTSFQHFINDVCMKYLNKFLIAYLNDLLIYSNNLKKHKQHVRKILRKLRETDIYIDIDKCEFHVIETKFLSVIVEKNEIQMIQMNSIKIKIIQK